MKTCNDCIYFQKDACSIKGDCFKPLISPSQVACSYFKSKGAPTAGVEIIRKMTKTALTSMALDMADKTLHDMANWKTRGKYPCVEKALRKWLEELGVIWEQ
jgi:hypothetical protein